MIIELSYDPVIPFLEIHPDKNIFQDQKDTCTFMWHYL